jgi:PAS domain S-box-containing protein
MERHPQLRSDPFPGDASALGWRVSVLLFGFALILLLITLLVTPLDRIDLSSMLLGIAFATFCVVLLLLAQSLLRLRRQEEVTANALDTAEASLLESEERFRQMADNIEEIFWMIDAGSRKIIYVNPAYEVISGRSRSVLRHDPLAYEDVLHPEDRVRVLTKLEEAVETGQFDERFRILTTEGRIRWLWGRGFPVRDAEGKIRRLVGTAVDITTQKQSEDEIIQSLGRAELACSEANAMRKATLALTQDLRMDSILDTFFQCLLGLIPFESGQILLMETENRLFVAREVSLSDKSKPLAKHPQTFNSADFPPIERVLRGAAGILLADTGQEPSCRFFDESRHPGSWLGVPLVTSRELLGLLCLSHSIPGCFTNEHLRLAGTLAIPAAAAIQNARLYECTRIYGSELEKQGADLRDAQNALRHFQSPHSS